MSVMNETATIPMEEYKRLKELDEAIGRNMIQITLASIMEFSFVTRRTVTYKSADDCMNELKEHIARIIAEADDANIKHAAEVEGYKDSFKLYESMAGDANKRWRLASYELDNVKEMSIFQFLKWRRK